jgi:hypothetical protein
MVSCLGCENELSNVRDMSEVFFYEKAGQQAGPLTADQLIAHGVEAFTLV